MNRLIDSPWRNLLAGLLYMLAVIGLATFAYVQFGWSWGDALYFVIVTVFTVGYGELHPITSPDLRAVTIITIVLGCTGVIFLTGAIVQFFTLSQLQQLLGSRRMKTKIEHMNGHVIVCGFGRIGHMLADELQAGQVDFVVVDRDEARLADAAEKGLMTWAGDATDETVLKAVGVERARALASVVPNDAVNVFITLSARNLNKNLEIIARGEAPSTKGMLLRAGANSVVEPTHIGAERIAQLILFPPTARITDTADRIRMLGVGLRALGLELEVVPVAADSPLAGASIESIEQTAGSSLFIVAIHRQSGETLTRPDPATIIEAGDGVVMITRSGRSQRPVA